MTDSKFGGGLLQQKKIWSVFPLGISIADLADGEQIKGQNKLTNRFWLKTIFDHSKAYRAPWELFDNLTKVPLRSENGEYLNLNARKKMALKNAYQALGMSYQRPFLIRSKIQFWPYFS